MASVNRAILIGNLGKDPEVRYAPSGDAIANVTLATTENWKDKSGEKQEKTEIIEATQKVAAWAKFPSNERSAMKKAAEALKPEKKAA